MTAPTPTTTASATQRAQLPVNKRFEDWDEEDGRAVLKAAIQSGPTEAGYEASRDYILLRDPWRNGKEWKGPRGTEDTETLVLAKVEKQHIPVDTINEVLDTAADALLERHPDLAFMLREPPDDPESEEGKTATDAAKRRAAPVIRALRAWGQKRRLVDLVRMVYKFSRWAGWGVLRTWVPTAKLDQVEGPTPEGEDEAPVSFAFPTGLTLVEALDRIYLSAPEPEACVVYEDPETKDRVAIFAYRFDEVDYVELWWADTKGMVHVRTLGGPADQEELTVDLLGWLPFAQVEGDLLITDSVRRQQARQNFFESLLVRVGEQAGFPERYTINAKPTGIWMATPPTDGPALETATDAAGNPWYLHPGVRTLGSAITTDLVGIATSIDQLSGKETVATPDVKRFDPVDPDFAIKAAKHAKQTIRAECKQGHLEMEGEATATGWSRVQARARFISDAMNHQAKIATLLADVYEAVLGYARLMTGELADFCEEQTPNITVRLSPGPVSPEERTAIQEQVEAGLMSPESAMVLLGVDDVQAELNRIRNSPEGKAAQMEKRLTLLGLATSSGLTVGTAAELVGFDEDELATIRRDAGTMPVSEGVPDGTVAGAEGQPGVPGELPPPVPGVDEIAAAPSAPAVDLGPVLEALAQLRTELEALRTAQAPAPVPQPIEVNVAPAPVTLNLPQPTTQTREITITRGPDGSLTGKVAIVAAEASITPPPAAA